MLFPSPFPLSRLIADRASAEHCNFFIEFFKTLIVETEKCTMLYRLEPSQSSSGYQIKYNIMLANAAGIKYANFSITLGLHREPRKI